MVGFHPTVRIDRFDFDLPPELIAQEPPAHREAARLMLVREQDVAHTTIAELARHIPEGSLVVVNDTKVMRARILGQKDGSGGKAEVFLVERDAEPNVWRAMARASKPVRPGVRIVSGALVADVLERADDGLFLVRLASSTPALSVDEAVENHAQVPLPPYIKREVTKDDEQRYQTVFAREPGAVAAPTAGLHLTHELLARIKARGCEVFACTLHVGLGTFQPVTAEDLDNHVMHSEHFEVTPELAMAVARARERRAPVVAVGTTVVRALESAATRDRPGFVRPCCEPTRMLIQPGYRFQVVDHLLTNFHLPKSTLLALVSAFAGTERILSAYRAAVRERYRFFSYGDAMFLSRMADS